MKWLFVLLLVVNVVLGGYRYLQDTRPNSDARIINLQMNADKIRVIPEPPRPKRTARTACLEWGTFGDLELERVRAALSAAGLEARVTESKSVVTANWWVYLPRQRSRARMERKANQLRELGITELETITEPGRWQYAISLGAFRMENSARNYVDLLSTSGVRTAVVGEREQQVSQTTLTIRAPSTSESTRLVELASRFPGSDMRAGECQS
jgi:hypothetical protein